MNKRRVFIVSAIAALGIAGGVGALNSMDAVAGHQHGGHHRGKLLALVCKGKGPQKLDGMKAKLTTKLELTADQEDNLAAVVQVVKDSNLKEFCPQSGEEPKTPTERLEKAEAVMTRSLETIQNLKTPVNTFYESLSTEQQQELNELMARRRQAFLGGQR